MSARLDGRPSGYPARKWLSYVYGPIKVPRYLTKCSQKQPFRACYDAKERYQSKTIMRTMPVENLKKGDLVLLEAQITRYSTAADGGNRQNITAKERAKNKAKGPTEWKVTFELVSVSLLSERPPSFDVESVDGPDFKESF